MTVEEYNNCVDLYSDGIYRFALKLLKDTDSAEDNVQDSFEKLWVKHSELEFTKAKSYFFTTCYNGSIDILRKEKRRTEYSNQLPDKEYSANINFDVSEVLGKAVDQLPEIQKSVLLLRDYEGYSYEEIGEITGLNESQVKVYIYRARLSLKNYLVSIENLI
ncbi:MAG TPA: RNA polymerase sigma factor [Tenuifilaceae bacterium]|nr:RNA polymerase sigma factor [Tenuifilaceae bacterium]